jgi:hypothetical protein
MDPVRLNFTRACVIYDTMTLVLDALVIIFFTHCGRAHLNNVTRQLSNKEHFLGLLGKKGL